MVGQVKMALYMSLGNQTLNDESLQTYLAEVEYTVNSRPLTECSDDPKDLEPITPNHFLLHRPVYCVPSAVVGDHAKHSRRCWKQIQYLCDYFLKRWTQEYLLGLQKRQKWFRKTRNFQIGDIVLIADESTHRGK